METRVNYVVVGIFVIVLGAFSFIAALWLSAGFQKKDYKTYEILMNEPVSGLSDQAPVKFNGVQVGFVKAISLNHHDPKQVRLLVKIEEGTPITTATVATLMAQGITGVTYIGLTIKGEEDGQPLKKQPGQRYPIIQSGPSLLVELDTAVRDLTNNIGDVTNSLKKILSDQNAQSLQNILINLDKVMSVFADNTDDLRQTLDNIKIISNNLALSSKDFPNLAAQLDKSAKALEQAGNETSSFFNEITPSTFNLMIQFNRLMDDFEQLSFEIKQDPSLLLRGKVSPVPGPGE